jgi:RNA polymerase sigma-70 factor (ECF subfamily)
MPVTSHPPHQSLDDDDAGLLARAGRQDHAAFEAIMRRYNGRLFRVARAILGDDSEAEDALQDAYLDAYRHISEFRGAASVATWLTRIVINQSLGRIRKRGRQPVIVPFPGMENPDTGEGEMNVPDVTSEPVPTTLMRGELRRLIERRIDELPLTFRTVFVMREIEGLSVEETAEALSIPSATVRTRLFRARALLREALARDVDTETLGVFSFAGHRCDRIVAGVLARLTEADRGA